MCQDDLNQSKKKQQIENEAEDLRLMYHNNRLPPANFNYYRGLIMPVPEELQVINKSFFKNVKEVDTIYETQRKPSCVLSQSLALESTPATNLRDTGT